MHLGRKLSDHVLAAGATRLAIVLTWLGTVAPPVIAQNQLWIDQIGTSADEGASAAAPDGSGGLYVSGATAGNLGGSSSGSNDVWVARWDGSANLLWLRQFGSLSHDYAYAVAPEELAGGVYVGGRTEGKLGAVSSGGFDAWIARHDSAGNQLWVRQHGTAQEDGVNAAVPDGAGGVYACGGTTGSLGGPNAGGFDAWLARYDGAGVLLWIRQFGTAADEQVFAGAPDAAGGVIASGATQGSLGSSNAGKADAWVARFDGAGNQLWVRQWGTYGYDFAHAATQDGAGGAFVGGTTEGSSGLLGAGAYDAWLARYDSLGNKLWLIFLGTPTDDRITGAAPDSAGGAYVSGLTFGSLGGQSAGYLDAWLSRYATTGKQLWIRQMGTPAADTGSFTASDGSGGAYIGGGTFGDLGGPSTGGADAWLGRYDSSCGAGSAYCAAKYTPGGCLPLVSWSGQPSASSATGFIVSASGIPNTHFGTFFYGTAGQQLVPFQGGWLCVKPPLMRTPLQTAGTGLLCSGTFGLDFNAHIASGKDPQLIAGVAVDGQYWFRNPVPPNNPGFTNGLHFVICP